MPFAERYALPIGAGIGTSTPRTNDFKELFYVRWGSIWFNVFWGPDLNIKVVLNVYRSCGACERFIVDTDPHDVRGRNTRFSMSGLYEMSDRATATYRRKAWRPTGTKRESLTPGNCSGTWTGAIIISIRCT